MLAAVHEPTELWQGATTGRLAEIFDPSNKKTS